MPCKHCESLQSRVDRLEYALKRVWAAVFRATYPTAEGSTPCIAGLHGEGHCEKVEHDGRTGHLHNADDDRPYDVDGVRYCGRCHGFMQ